MSKSTILVVVAIERTGTATALRLLAMESPSGPCYKTMEEVCKWMH